MTENNMPASIGVNLRVTGHCRQGGRKYMEDFFSVAYQQTEDEKDLEYAFFGIYDGHGGAEAAAFAKEHLMETIIKHKSFWSDDDKDVLRAIKDGYIATHYAMWRVQEKWPRTASGLPSTAGTTASVAFIRRGKIYIGHVGDSGIILGLQEPGCSEWKAVPLTKDHKPENFDEMVRIKNCGGKVVSKSGVPRVVWNRPKIGHQGPVRRSTPIDEIPFLAVARSLGDLWSYNYQSDSFIVSPDPDCSVIKINTNTHRCLIFGTDGLYNMLSPSMAVHIVQQVERHNENAALSDSTYKTWLNPSKLLVEKALERWHSTKMRADNTSVVTLMLDPPGPPRAQVLKDRKKNLPERGLKIMTRFDNEPSQDTDSSNCDTSPRENPDETLSQTMLEPAPEPSPVLKPTAIVDYSNKDENKTDCISNPPGKSTSVSSSDLMTNNFPLKERNFLQKPRENTGPLNSGKENFKSQNTEDNIQCNEVSSSNIEVDSLCIEEEENDVQGRNKHNLRSCRKDKSDIKVAMNKNESDNKNKGTKTKLDQTTGALEAPRPRKSMRIDNNLKKAEETVEKERRAFEAEEKLKKLAEKADLAKRKKSTGSPSSSLSQKLQNHYSKTKQKEAVLNKPIAKNKIKYMMNKVKRVQSKVIFRTQSVKPAKNQKLMKNLKMIAEKAMLQKHNKRNPSQRQRKVTVTETPKKTGPKLKPKFNSKSAENVTKLNTPNLRQSSRHSSPTKSGPSGMVQNDLEISQSENKSQTRSLKKRLQQKTESLKQNVMKRK
ncbi:unnamed protein product [Phyllotreta striolata]|uniref:PPM-type phosphatase domain-containing protein n=1 Tax=Phyllotreta striolata TaxID=444603 RepID=A0A9N9TLV9_PHYSR|nr:unnamed protein product [Phyllotreta striolata]